MKAVSHSLLRMAFAVLLAALAGTGGAQQPAGTPGPFVADTKAGAHLRSMYFERDTPGPEQKAWAVGGWLYGTSGYFNDVLQLGATGYFSLPLYAPDDKTGHLMLDASNDGYSVIGEAFARLKHADHRLTLYRQLIRMDAPRAEGVRANRTDGTFVGPRDLRMTPVTYEAALVNGPIGESLRYYAGYVANGKRINETRFVSMGELAGAPTSGSGMLMGGVQWSPMKEVWIQGWYHHVADVIRIAFADLDWVHRTSQDSYVRVGAQLIDQRSSGDDRLTGRDFSTRHVGLYGEGGWRWLKAYVGLGKTDDGERIFTPYAYGPHYFGQRIREFVRAGERATLLGATFDLAAFGARGLSFDANVANGRNAINAASGAALADWREFDTDLVYAFAKESPLAGMRVRLRYAKLYEDQPGGQTDKTTDFRIDLNWTVPFN